MATDAGAKGIFKKYYSRLQECLNPEDVATKLKSHSLISANEHQQALHVMYTNSEKNQYLLAAVERAINVDEKNFECFLDILETILKYKILVHEMRAQLNEPHPRWAHVASAYKGHVYIWGGRIKYGSSQRRGLGKLMHRLDIDGMRWTELITSGDPPSALERCAYATSKNMLYVYGGYDWLKQPRCHNGDLHGFNLDTLTWTMLAEGSTLTPRKKAGAGMAVWSENLILFGGYGEAPSSSESDLYKFEPHKDGNGWNNAMNVYSLSKGSWEFKRTTNTPSPCQGLSLTCFEDILLLKFGGKGMHAIEGADVLDLKRWEWSKMKSQNLPTNRFFHSAFLMDSESKLVIAGGCTCNDSEKPPAKDVHILHVDLSSGEPYKWKLCSNVEIQRSHHSVTCFTMSTVEAIVFGGCPKTTLSRTERFQIDV